MHTANLFYIFAGVGFNLFYIFAGVGFVYLKYDTIYASQCSKAKNCYLHLSFLVFQQFTGAKYKEAWKNAYGMDFIVKSGSGKLLVSYSDLFI